MTLFGSPRMPLSLRGVRVMLVTPSFAPADQIEATLRARGAETERVHPRDNWRWWFFERLPHLLIIFLVADEPLLALLLGTLAAADVMLRAPLLAVSERPLSILPAGVSDLIVAPYTIDDVLTRAEQLLTERNNATPVVAGNIAIDLDGHMVWVSGRPVVLTRTEFALLAFLMTHRSRVFSRDRLCAELWPNGNAPSARAIDVHLTRLRAKLGGARGVRIATVRGVGYRFQSEPADKWPESPRHSPARRRAV